MTRADKLHKISIAERGRQLTQPFTMVDLAQIDDLALSLFLCQGTMPHHRHMDQDELFLVHSGTITLESEWGTALLRPGEMAVAVKGLAHRSSSVLPSLVLLLQPRLMVNRRNGDRRLFTMKEQGRLEKVSVPAMGHGLTVPFSPVTLGSLDRFDVTLMLCRGAGPAREASGPVQSSLLLCHTGRVAVETERERIELEAGELVVVPAGVTYGLDSPTAALVIGVRPHPHPGPAQ